MVFFVNIKNYVDTYTSFPVSFHKSTCLRQSDFWSKESYKTMQSEAYTTYSQINQDVNILDFYQHKVDGFFVDIGAYDGIALSNTYTLKIKAEAQL